MTALVVTGIVLGILLALAAIGIPLWQSSRSLVTEADAVQAQAYQRARAAVAPPAVTVPAPRRAAEEAVRTLHEVG